MATPHLLDGVVMVVADSAPSAVIGRDTVFCFDQNGSTVTSSYGGGSVTEGRLIGTIDSALSHIRFRYLQVDRNGNVDSGESNVDVGRLADGRWSMIEHFRWTSRGGHGTNRLVQAHVSER